MSCDAGWSSAACTKCVAKGHPRRRRLDTCPQCGGAGKVARSACCARHDDDAGGGHDHGHGHGHGQGAGAGTVFGAIGPPGSTLPGFTGTIPASLEELFATLELVDVKGDRVVAKEAFENKVVGVYFSASHCPACVRFSPTLDAFTERNAADYVTVLVPGDKDERSAARYHKTLGANSSPSRFGSIHRTLLMTAYSVYAIPALHVALRRREARHRLGAHGGDARAGDVRQGLARRGTRLELVRYRECQSRGAASPSRRVRFERRCSPRKEEAPRKRDPAGALVVVP